MKNYGPLKNLDPNNFPDHPVQTPEDLYGAEITCPECDNSFYEDSLQSGCCPECGFDITGDAFIEPDYDDYDVNEDALDYPERYGLI